MSERYRPIDCSLHDEFELRALRRTRCVLAYRDETGRAQCRDARIVDVVTRHGVEFLCLEDGAEIRLDRITEADGRRV